MIEINLEIPGRPIAKKNNPRVFCISGCRGWRRGQGNQPKKLMLPSADYEAYEKMALNWLLQYGNQYIVGMVEVRCLYWMPDKRSRPDLVGLLQATSDILQKSGLIANDRDIISYDGSRIMGADKERPRVELRIRQFFDKEFSLEIDKHILLTDSAKGN